MSFTPSIDEAASYLSSAPSLSKVSTTIKLELYGLFKYLKVAPKPQGSRPHIFDMTGRAKWDAWKAASDTYVNNSHAAAQRYRAIAQELGWKPDSTPNSASGKRSEDEGADTGVRNDSAGSGSSSGGGGMGTSVSLLINPGPDVGEAQTLHGLAIAGDAEKLMAFLLVNPAVDVNARDEFDYTALHLACDRGNLSVVQALLSNGGDPLLKDPDDYTAAELAQVAGHQEIYDLLSN
ncbi:ankyrin repeat-containing domain protein [Suillus fuscotomentosus]|uniref:Ankyrin repeat-containing domain protein n=1 Tax=Suillus fuscotomentosus TaxID=1912939 RepID=A0AAD4HTX1_9AGAM|nr:ankyrin repeat-containing domain protein [Suillus fuscotomentosus]KAG1908186.1 ankyrin repeat-containing domain protein [Suillus fuscotomentosus]